jgi:hypothetical protein
MHIEREGEWEEESGEGGRGREKSYPSRLKIASASGTDMAASAEKRTLGAAVAFTAASRIRFSSPANFSFIFIDSSAFMLCCSK